jgi:hypothetical protein
MAAVHAANGRDAVAFAPSLLEAGHPAAADLVPDGDGDCASASGAADVGELSLLLLERLTRLAQIVPSPGDHQACLEGARCADEIHRLLVGPYGT